MLFANQPIRTPLTVGGVGAVFQVVAGEALVASGVVVFEDGQGKAGGGGSYAPHLVPTAVAALTQML